MWYTGVEFVTRNRDNVELYLMTFTTYNKNSFVKR